MTLQRRVPNPTGRTAAEFGWHNAAFFVPHDLNDWKRSRLFGVIEPAAAMIVRGNGRRDDEKLAAIPDSLIPVVGCFMQVREIIPHWIRTGRPFVYWDRGYVGRGGRQWLVANGTDRFRWHYRAFQMRSINPGADPSRWHELGAQVRPWRSSGEAIVVAAASTYYERYHGIEGWTERAVEAARATGRPVIVREKICKRPLFRDVKGAHCLVTHASVAAVEAVIYGCPVFVDPSSAAALVGRTDWEFDKPIMPPRESWLYSLASSQFSIAEIRRGTCWNVGDVQQAVSLSPA